jgi:hypothetical protein
MVITVITQTTISKLVSTLVVAHFRPPACVRKVRWFEKYHTENTGITEELPAGVDGRPGFHASGHTRQKQFHDGSRFGSRAG